MQFETAPSDAAATLKIPASAKLRRIKRIVRADERPVIYVDDFIGPLVESAGLNWDAFDGNMVQFLSASVHPALRQIQSQIRVAPLDSEAARHLGLEEATPILSVSSTIYTVDDQPITFSKVCFNSDIVELNIVRTIRTY